MTPRQTLAAQAKLPFVSLAQLESFVAVAEEGHLTRAARRLHISQPPLSRRIQELEHELGVPLFERTHRGMRLLPAGATLLESARSILSEVEQARLRLTPFREACLPAASPDPATDRSRN